MEFNLPELGEGVYEAEVVRWLVSPGEAVKPGQTLMEVLTDKATMEVPAPFAGVVQKLLVEPDQKVKVGQAMLEYGEKKDPATKMTSKTESNDAPEKAKPKPESKDGSANPAPKS